MLIRWHMGARCLRARLKGRLPAPDEPAFEWPARDATVDHIDIVSPDFHADPVFTLEKIRHFGKPVVRMKLPIIGNISLCTTHEACSALLKDHGSFVRDPANAGNLTQARILKMLPRTLSLLALN